jgi:hypothetical protein
MPSVQYDVFVSYSHSDATWVRGTLVPRLEANNFSVMIDYRDFVAGSLSVDEMQRGVEQSRHVLLVLTPDYIRSDWSHFENAMAQATDPAARWRKVIPVLLRDCSIPLRIRIVHYRDLRTDDPQQWDLLIRDLI